MDSFLVSICILRGPVNASLPAGLTLSFKLITHPLCARHTAYRKIRWSESTQGEGGRKFGTALLVSCGGIAWSRVDREFGIFQHVAPTMRLLFEFPHETGLIRRFTGNVGNPCRKSMGIDPPVAIRRGEGAHRKWCRELWCFPRVSLCICLQLSTVLSAKLWPSWSDWSSVWEPKVVESSCYSCKLNK